MDACADTVTLQPGPGLNDGTDNGGATAGKDAGFVGYPGGNDGEAAYMFVTNSPCNVGTFPAFLQFSLDDLPAQDIFKAEIQVYTWVFFNGNGWPWEVGTYDIALRRITSAWDEMTVSQANQPITDPAVIDAAAFTAIGGSGSPFTEFMGWMTFDITDLYRGWAESSIPNHGVAFQLEQPICANGDIIWLFSSDYADDTGLRPKLVVTTQSECVHQPPDIISWWDAENNANDIIGKNDGTLMNGTTFTPGKVGQAFSFDGVDDYVQVQNPDGLPLGNAPRTMEVWFKTPGDLTISTESAIVQYGTASESQMFGLITSMNAPGKLYFYGHGSDLSGTTTIQPDTWYHGAVTYDGSNLSLYMNGQLEASTTMSLNTTLDVNGLTMGHRNDSSRWQGVIDEVGIFNRALTAEEIEAIYSAGSAGKCKPLQTYTLSVETTGTGSGTVASDPAGIVCGNDCEEAHDEGTVVTLTATADAGSGFAGWSGACTGMGSCVINMTEDVSVTATFQVPTFTDVPAEHWAFGWIEILYADGITTGYSDGTYRPGGNVTRGQMAVFIVRAKYGDSFTCNETPYFTDVPSGHWAFRYIQKMYEDDITTGYPDGTYRPGGNVTRGQMAAFIIRALYGESFTYNEEPYFSDVPESHGAFKYIQKITEEGIATGYSDGTYRPAGNVTRGQMAAFIGRAFLGMQ
jgi:hypothetical protein